MSTTQLTTSANSAIALHLLRGIESLVVPPVVSSASPSSPAVVKTAAAALVALLATARRSAFLQLVTAAATLVRSYYALEALAALYLLRRVAAEIRAAKEYAPLVSIVPA